jgi:hypothetical protein
MKTKITYVKLLHFILFFFFLIVTNALFAQTTYEGFGAGAIGGGNSTTVYRVTSLNGSGAGSLANGIGSNKTIVFDVGGTITGSFNLAGITYLTIDGSTAPAPGITINGGNNGDAISFDGANCHHIIMKNIRVQNAGNDGINVIDGAHDIIIDHCSSRGNRDGNLDISTGSFNVTVQYCILGGGANDPGYSGTMLLGYSPKNISVHHTLFSPATPGQVGERCPNISDPNLGSAANYLMADFRNNLVWKWGRNGGTGSGYGTAVFNRGTANVVNNYYYSTQNPESATNTDDGYGSGANGQAYMAGNFSGNTGVNPNGPNNHAEWPIPSNAAINMQTACASAAIILAQAGPRPLDAADQAIVNAITLINCPATGQNQPPTANAGNNVTLTLPTNSTTLTGSGTDPDGTIASYAWTRVSGPTTFTLGTANAATTALSNLVAGTYVFRLTVTDNSGATGTDDVTVTVNAAANQPPTANAGNDITLTLPTNSTTLTGSGSDPGGTIASYAWTRVSGPTTFTLGTANAATTALNNLVAGTYVFRLTVTDNGGATGTDDITVTVNAAANQPPTANAGNDITLTLPTNSTTLTGSGTDPGGTIAGYAWVRVSGPTTFTLGTANAATTTLTNLVQGTYVFRLTVTDNGGATGTDNVTVTVNPVATPGNQSPTANAGNDITMTLPANSGTLSGSGTDPDGTIAVYAWTRVSGPTTFTLGTANAATTTLTNLVQGVYVFRLTVTDNGGATGTDNITVTVNAAPPPSGNQPPTARTDNDMTLTLPANSVQMHGNTSSDPDGIIVSYEWSQLSGPNQVILIDRITAVTTISDLVAGVYKFQLKVTDDDGASSTKIITVTVVKSSSGDPIVVIYPNPSPGVVTIQYTSNINGKVKIIIYDAGRKMMRSEIIEKSQTTITTTIDISAYRSGIYFIRIVAPDRVKTTVRIAKI